MQRIPVAPEHIHGAAGLEKRPDGLKPWRIPFESRMLFEPALRGRAECQSGVRVRFETDSRTVGLAYALPDGGPGRELVQFDLVVDDELVDGADRPPDATEVVFETDGGGTRVAEIWLPLFAPVTITDLLVDDGASVGPAPDTRLRWTAYGSSITHGRGADRPAHAWPARAARMLGWNLTSFGYGGNCHMEPATAMLIRDTAADVISLKVGVNIVSAASLSPRTFQANLIGMVRIIREKQPEAVLLVISAIPTIGRCEEKNAVGMTLDHSRGMVREAVERLHAAGVEKLFHFSGLDMLGPDECEGRLPDGVHPNADGYRVMAENFVEKIVSATPGLR